MTPDSAAIIWIVVIIAAIVVGALLYARRRGPPTFDRDELVEQTKQVAQQAVKEATENAQQAAILAYQKQQEELQREQAGKRKEAAARAKETKARRIETLQPWRETFVLFVRRLAKPFFAEFLLDDALLDEWARERADVYIAKKPYVLEIIQSVHADARRAAESYASTTQKSGREIARERAKPASRSLDRNRNCSYCNAELDEKAHLDHIVPVNRGGPSEPWNMVFVCMPCNHAKHDHSLLEFVETDYARRKGLKLSDIIGRLKELDKYADVWQ